MCEDLISVLERAAMLYVSPSFTEALDLASEHQPHLKKRGSLRIGFGILEMLEVVIS